MTKQLSSRDYETLSAYLDGELSPKEHLRVESRLQTTPELRAGLEELKYTHRLLSKVPMRRAPRNFTLKPSMLPQKRRLSFAYPTLRLASALASILLVVAFASDLFLSMGLNKAVMRTSAPAQGVPTAQLQMAPPQATPDVLAAAPKAPEPQSTQEANRSALSQATPEITDLAAGSSLAADTPTPEIVATGEPPMFAAGILPTPTGTIVGLGGGPAPDETQAAIVAQTNAPPGLGEGTNPASTVAPGFHYEATEPSPENTVAADAQTLGVETPTPETEASEAPLVLQAPNQPAASSPAVENSTQPAAAQIWPPILRVAEVVLALTALITGLAALFLRLRGNP